MATLRQALQYASENPQSDFAKFLTERIQSGQADAEARQTGIDLTPIKALALKPPVSIVAPGFFSRVGSSYADTGQEILSGIGEGASQIQRGIAEDDPTKTFFGAMRGGLRMLGGVAKAAFAPILEAPIVKPALEKAGELITKVPGAQDFMKQLMDLSQKYPEAAKDVQNIIDTVALAGLPIIEKPLGAITGETASKAGVALEKSGLATQKAVRESFSKKLVMPKETAAVKLEQVGRTTERGGGIFKRSEIKPNYFEQRAIAEVTKIPEIKSTNTFQTNYNIIKDINFKKAEQLTKLVKENAVLIPRKETIARLKVAASHLGEHPLIAGDAETTANRLIEGAKKFINENPGTTEGLLKARKEYDNWVLSQKPAAFDAKAENAFSISNREIREVMNTMLDEKIPDVGTRKLRHEQSSLFDAMENIAPKAAEEANTAIGRALQRTGQTLGTKSKIVQGLAAAIGIGGLGAAATFAPAVAAVGAGGYVIYKGGTLILKPEVRIALGKLLQEAGNLLNSEDRKIFENAINQFKELPKAEGAISVQETGLTQSISKAKASGQSFDEWVRGQGEVLYHGSPEAFSQYDLTRAGQGSTGNAFGTGAYFTDKFQNAKDYATGYGNVNAVLRGQEGTQVGKVLYTIKPPGKLLDLDKFLRETRPLSFYKEGLAKMEKVGFEGVSKNPDVIQQLKKGVDNVSIDNVISRLDIEISNNVKYAKQLGDRYSIYDFFLPKDKYIGAFGDAAQYGAPGKMAAQTGKGAKDFVLWDKGEPIKMFETSQDISRSQLKAEWDKAGNLNSSKEK